MAYTETLRDVWSDPKVAEDTDDTLLTAAVGTMKFANIPDDSYRPRGAHNAIEIAFTMDAAASACVATLFAARKNGDIVQVWTGTLTAGTQEATDGGTWVDTIGSSTDTWITTIKEVDGGGNDRMSRLVMDTCGYSYFFVQVTGLTGSETLKTFYSGF